MVTSTTQTMWRDIKALLIRKSIIWHFITNIEGFRSCQQLDKIRKIRYSANDYVNVKRK